MLYRLTPDQCKVSDDPDVEMSVYEGHPHMLARRHRAEEAIRCDEVGGARDGEPLPRLPSSPCATSKATTSASRGAQRGDSDARVRRLRSRHRQADSTRKSRSTSSLPVIVVGSRDADSGGLGKTSRWPRSAPGADGAADAHHHHGTQRPSVGRITAPSRQLPDPRSFHVTTDHSAHLRGAGAEQRGPGRLPLHGERRPHHAHPGPHRRPRWSRPS